MSNVHFDKRDLKKRIPKEVLDRTKENMETYGMSLLDSFEEAARELASKGTELYKAWYFSDFRAFLPCIYSEEYLDFERYPLKCKLKYYRVVCETKKGRTQYWAIDFESSSVKAARRDFDKLWKKAAHPFGITVKRIKDTEEFQYHKITEISGEEYMNL